MKSISFAAMLTLAVASTPAMAQDNPLGGLYFGGIVGVDSVEISDGVDSGSEEDILYGVTFGYDLAGPGVVVLGIEGEWADSGVGASVEDVFVAGDRFALSTGRDLYAGVRAGYRIGENGMLYVKGGYTDAKLKASYDDGVDTLTGSDTLGGFRVGAGGEFALGGNFAIRAEYRYSDYGNYSYDGIDTGLSATRHQGVVGMLAKF